MTENSPETRQIRDAQMEKRGLISIPAAAAMIGLSEPRVYGLTRLGLLERKKVVGGLYVTKASVKAFIAARKPPKGKVTVTQAMRTYAVTSKVIEDRIREGKLTVEMCGRKRYLVPAELEAVLRG